MQVTITNLLGAPIFLRDLYTTLRIDTAITITRSWADLSRMAGLIEAEERGDVRVEFALEDAEQSSALITPPSPRLAVADQGGSIHRFTITPSGGDDWESFLDVLNRIPSEWRNAAYVIDITGCDITVPDGFVWPTFQSSDQLLSDPDNTDFGSSQAPLTVFATPSVVETIASGDITSDTAQTKTALRKLVTTKTWVVDAYKGKLLLDANGLVGVVTSNTVTDLFTTSPFPLVAPIRIADPDGIFRQTAGSVSSPIDLRGSSAAIRFAGVRVIQSEAPDSAVGVTVHHCPSLVFQGCVLDGYDSVNCPNQTLSACVLTAGKQANLVGVATQLSQCLCLGSKILNQGGTFFPLSLNYADSVFDACDGVGVSPDVQLSSGWLSILRCEVKNGTATGIFFEGLGACEVVDCHVHNNASHGLWFLRGEVRVQNCLVENNSGDGLRGEFDATIFAALASTTGISGTGNTGVGVRALRGTHIIERLANVLSVTGTGGDVKCGNQSVAAYTTYHVTNALNDVTTNTGDLSMIRIN